MLDAAAAAGASLRRRFWSGESDGASAPTLDLGAIAARMVPAAMGRGADTVIDPTSRRCTVSKDGSAFHWPGQAQALEELREQAMPWLPPGSLEASFHSIICYRRGDFFRWHRDSMKSANHVMTLSVDCTPPPEEAAGDEADSDAAKDLPQGATIKFVEPTERKFSGPLEWASSGRGRWAAWHNTVFHEVSECTKGVQYRATLNVSIAEPALGTFDLPEGHPANQWCERLKGDIVASLKGDGSDTVRKRVGYIFGCQYLRPAGHGVPP